MYLKLACILCGLCLSSCRGEYPEFLDVVEPAFVPSIRDRVYEVNDVQFRMREIPAGGGVASFLMAETEVTQELYEAVMGSNPSHFTGDDPDHNGFCVILKN